MPPLIRRAEDRDVLPMAALRAEEWETQAYWENRIRRYRSGEASPQQALAPRELLVAVDAEAVIGFVAGHLTRRLGCQGELQWINVAQTRRGHGVGGLLLTAMADWFLEQKALRVCVNAEPDNRARALYAKHGALPLGDHWMVWEEISRVRPPRA